MPMSSAKPQQIAIPLGADGYWLRVAEEEAPRNTTSAAHELQAATLLSHVTGMSFAEAETALRKAGGLHRLAQLPEAALHILPHIGPKRAQQIRAMTDWSLLLNSVQEWQAIQVRSAADVANLVMLEMGLLEQEELRVISLDTKNRVVDVATIYKGSVNTTMIRIAEVLRLPVALQCSNMILLHNHPSGDPSPSPEDIVVTEKIRECATAMDIILLDHVIIGNNRYVSLRERGLGFEK